MLRTYFDESGTVPPSRVATMGGVMARPESWRVFSREWTRVLTDAEVRGEYKATDCVAGKGAFAHLAVSERTGLRRSLGQVIDAHVSYGFAVSIPLRDFKDVTAGQDWLGIFREPYPWLVRACLDKMALTPLRRDQKVECVFDEGPGHQDECFERFRVIRDRHEWGDAFISITGAPSHDFRPLQAAEWLAYEMRHDLDFQLHRATKHHLGFSTIFRRMTLELLRFDREGLERLARPPSP